MFKKYIIFFSFLFFLSGCTKDSGNGGEVENKEVQDKKVSISGNLVIPSRKIDSVQPQADKKSKDLLPGSHDFVPGEIIIEYLNDKRDANLSLFGIKHVKKLSQNQSLYRIIALDEKSLKELELRTIDLVNFINDKSSSVKALPNYIRKSLGSFYIPDDPYFDDQWNIKMCELHRAWKLKKDAKGVVVAIIDNGISSHKDLVINFGTNGFDFISSEESSDDGDGIDSDPFNSSGFHLGWHGTAVAGIIGASTDNSFGISGIAPHCEMFSVRVVGSNGADDYDIAQAVLYSAAIENDSEILPLKQADIINLSLGGPGKPLEILEDAIEKAVKKGCIIVAAAGNSNNNTPIYPAACNGVISVSGLKYGKVKAASSSYGNTIDISAPGGDSDRGVLSLDYSGFQEYRGTSFAAPHVSGILALGKSIYMDLNYNDANLLIKGIHPDLFGFSITDDLGTEGYDIYYGNGLINAYKTTIAAEKLKSGEDIFVSIINYYNSDDFITIKTGKKENYYFNFQGLNAGRYYIIAYTDRYGRGSPSKEDDIWGKYISKEDENDSIILNKGDNIKNISFALDNNEDISGFL